MNVLLGVKHKMTENLETLLKEKGYWNLFSEGGQFEEVLQSSKLKVLIKHWPTYERVRVIVVGSSPAPCFRSTGGFVGENTGTYLSPTVVKLQKALDSAFYNSANGDDDDDQDSDNDDKDGSNYDYNAMHSKMDHGILFVNVCLQQISREFAEFSIGFINRILKRKHIDNEPLAVLDMRLDKHIHESETAFSTFSNMRMTELGYKLESLNFHKLFRLGHPNDFHSHFTTVVKELQTIRESYPEIASIYRTQETCKSNKFSKLRCH
jgi:hypothetical protein